MITIKGTSYYQNTIRGLENWSIGTLRLEPNNEYDADACAVEVDGELVGYLPKGWKNEYYGPEMLVYIESIEREGRVSLRKVGGYSMGNGKTATEGLRLITRADLKEEFGEE